MPASERSQESQSWFPLTATQIDWPAIIKQWQSSGMSRLVYCETNNINYKKFVYQCTKLSARTKADSKLLPVKIAQPDHIYP